MIEQIAQGSPWYEPAIVIGMSTAHLAFYIWAKVMLASGRVKRARQHAALAAYMR